MTKFGKYLVFINLALSFAMMIWGVNLYLHRTDLTDNPAKDGNPPGEMVRRIDELKKVSSALPAAEVDWREARKSRDGLEAQRRDARKWYIEQLALLDNNPKGGPVQEIVLDAARQPLPVDPLKPTAFKMQPINDRAGKPLMPTNVYAKRETNRMQGSPNDATDTVPIGYLAARQSQLGSIKRDLSATVEMNGPKGLHSRLQDERTKRDNVLLEQKLLEPVLVQTATESQFSREREKELRARVEELREKLKELKEQEKRLGAAGAP